jgi:hypothetical protein
MLEILKPLRTDPLLNLHAYDRAILGGPKRVPSPKKGPELSSCGRQLDNGHLPVTNLGFSV